MALPGTTSPPAADYRRGARRLRAQFAAHPGRLQHALRDLARQHDRRATARPGHDDRRDVLVGEIVDRPARTARGAFPSDARRFAERVAAELDEGLLRHSQRVALLRDATRQGIDRFEANLIIAAVQHRGGMAAREASTVDSPPGPSSVAKLVLAVFSVQSLIVGAVWWLVGA